MRISAVIPSYNRRHSLERALQSVFAQTSPVDEVILVDDGSTDDSAAMTARRFPEAKIIRQPNRGVSAARNSGIRAARHDWIALLDSDDSWLPQKILRIREAARQHPGHVLYHSDEIWMRRGVRVNPKHKHRKSGGWIFEQCLPLCAISPSASVLCKPTLHALGLFDESLPACEDYDLWLRLCHRFPVHFVARALIVKYGGHDDQLSRKFPAMDRYRVRALHRLLETETLSGEHFDAARATLRTKLAILHKGALKHGNLSLIDEIEPLQQRWCDNYRQQAC
jgi:glycosyltransferase involved in cell wall biosynthesis